MTEKELESESDGARALRRRVDAGAPSVSSSGRVNVALEALNEGSEGWVSVLDRDRRVVGTPSTSDLVRAYRRELQASFARLTALRAWTSAYEVTIPDDSSIVGVRLRNARLPRGVPVTSIAREGDVIQPTGDTMLLVGDQLSVLGGDGSIAALGMVSEPSGPERSRA